MSATIITLPMVAAALIILEQMLDWSTVGALQRRAGLGGFRGKVNRSCLSFCVGVEVPMESNGKADNLPASGPLSEESCVRCGGLMIMDHYIDLQDDTGQIGLTALRCTSCRHRARTKGKHERMVGYVKQNFFVRYREFESWVHLNQLAEQWLREEADQRVHGTLHEVVAERFGREQEFLKPLPRSCYDTSYYETRRVNWDGYVNVGGNRYSVPGALCGQRVAVRIGLDGSLRVYHAEILVATHTQRAKQEGWSTIAEHHSSLWRDVLQVARRPLALYEETQLTFSNETLGNLL